MDEARPSAAAPSPTESEAGAVATPIGGGGRIVAISGPHLTMFDVVQNESFVIQGNVDASGPAAFSPDGELVLFDDSDGIFRTIFAYDTVSGAVEELGIVDEAYHPAWSPDGSHIVLVTTANGNPDLAVVDLEGSGELEILDPDPATDEYPSFSPDGSQILFESDRAGSPALYLLDAAGVYPFSEPNQGWADRYGRFSPDGSTIAFASSRDRSDGATEIYVQPVVGGPARRLTSFGSGNASGPTWSPDGRLLAFFSDAAGNNDIYVVRVDNGQVIQITNGPEDERWPVWGP